MKKFISFFAAAAMACLAVVSCEDNTTPDNGDNGDTNTPGNTDKPGEGNTDTPVEPATLEITIDGQFADWDAATASNDDQTVYVCDAPHETLTSIKNLKVTSDADFIYMYLEVNTADVAVIANGDPGDSNTGITAGGVFQTSPGPIYIDINAGSADAILPHTDAAFTNLEAGDAGYVWNNFTMDNAVQLNFYRDDSAIELGWSQNNALQAKFAGDKYNEESDFQGVDGNLWDPAQDNVVVTFDNFKGVVDGATVKLEFAIDPSMLFVDGEQGADIRQITFGVFYKNSGSTEYAYSSITGILPGDRVPATLVLNK